MAGRVNGGASVSGMGGFPDEGEGGTVLDGLIVRGTALSKLAPEALQAAIGPSPDTSSGGGTGGGTLASGRGRTALSVFSNHAVASTAGGVQRLEASGQALPASQLRVPAMEGSPPARRDACTGRSSTLNASEFRLQTATGLPGAEGSTTAACNNDTLRESMSLLPELSLNVMGFGCPGSIEAAAATTVTVIDTQQEGCGAESDGAANLVVVGTVISRTVPLQTNPDELLENPGQGS